MPPFVRVGLAASDTQLNGLSSLWNDGNVGTALGRRVVDLPCHDLAMTYLTIPRAFILPERSGTGTSPYVLVAKTAFLLYVTPA